MRALMIAAVLFAAATMAHAEVIYVDIDATGANDGTSWLDAYADLQDALRRAEPGDDVWVAEGIYFPATNGDQLASFRLESGVRILGGFAGGELRYDDAHRDRTRTVLSGDLGLRRGPADDWRSGEHLADNSFRIVDGSGADRTAVLDGFTVTGGMGRDSWTVNYDSIAAVFVEEGAPRISNLLITEVLSFSCIGLIDSRAVLRGVRLDSNQAMFSPISCLRGAPEIYDSQFLSAVSISGAGGIGMFESAPMIEGCVFENNSAHRGGAIGVHTGSRPAVTNCVIRNNYSGMHGGAIEVYDASTVKLTNVVFADNAGFHAGAIACVGSTAQFTALNCSFWGNRGLANEDNGGSAGAVSGQSCEITNSIVFGNSSGSDGPRIRTSDDSAVRHSLVEGSGGSGAVWKDGFGQDLGGNIDTDPLFADPENGDFRLTYLSPAIDAGDTDVLPESPTLDLDGAPRVFGADVDMGAYEFQGPSWRSIFAARVSPQTLNRDSGGQHVQVDITAMADYHATTIDEASVALNDSIAPVRMKAGRRQLKLKFDREQVLAALEPGPRVAVTVTGTLVDGTPFAATDTIAVIGPKGGRDSGFGESAPTISSMTAARREYLRAAPNPFNPSTTISFAIAQDGPASLVIYDLAGRRVRTLASGFVTAGQHQAQWDGRDEQGRRVASGVYLYRLVAGEFMETKRMVLLK